MDSPEFIIQPADWQVGNFFVSEGACLRCAEPYKPGGEAVLVRASPHVVHDTPTVSGNIGVSVCIPCLCDQWDVVEGTFHLPDTRFRQSWPRYIGNAPLPGYAVIRRLGNGTYRVALRYGHVELWTPDQVVEDAAISRVIRFGYARDPRLSQWRGLHVYGPVTRLKAAYGRDNVISERESRPVDLSKPEPLWSVLATDVV